MHRFKTEEIRKDPGPPRMFAEDNSSTFLITLGTGTPSPNPFRMGPAGAVIVNETPYLIDAGEGVTRSIAKAASAHNNRFADCFDPQKLTNLFITHLHSDHVVGLPSLILNPWIFGRKSPLNVFGPSGTKNLVNKILDAYQVDIKERLNSLDPAPPEGWKVKVHEIKEDTIVMKNSNITVEAFHHKHGDMDNLGYRFTTKDKIIIWAGDGQINNAMLKASKDADILVTELCTEDNIDKSPWGGMSVEEKNRTIWSYHLKPSILADFAIQANVKTLVLVHESNYSFPYEVDSLYNELKRYYQGKVISSRDSDVF